MFFRKACFLATFKFFLSALRHVRILFCLEFERWPSAGRRRSFMTVTSGHHWFCFSIRSANGMIFPARGQFFARAAGNFACRRRTLGCRSISAIIVRCAAKTRHFAAIFVAKRHQIWHQLKPLRRLLQTACSLKDNLRLLKGRFYDERKALRWEA